MKTPRRRHGAGPCAAAETRRMAITTSGSSITLSITVGPSANAVLRVNLVAGPRPLAEYSTMFLIPLALRTRSCEGAPASLDVAIQVRDDARGLRTRSRRRLLYGGCRTARGEQNIFTSCLVLSDADTIALLSPGVLVCFSRQSITYLVFQ